MEANDIDRQLKQLELDKKTEELRQLRANSRIRWITPTALAALLPLLAAFGVWIVGELKGLSEGQRALDEIKSIRAEHAALKQQKDSLNIELNTLLQLKAHYAQEAERLHNETVAKQGAIDQNYMRAVFTSSEAIYALDHIKGIETPSDAALNKLRLDGERLPQASRQAQEKLFEHYQLSRELLRITRGVMAEFDSTLKIMPASDWTQGFQARPSGMFGLGRDIMVKEQKGNPPLYYDVKLARQLTTVEAQALRR